MSGNYSNENRGVLFKNDKEGNEKRPDYTGNINVDGRELRIAAWIKEGKSGKKFMSLNVSEFDSRSETGNTRRPEVAQSQGGFDDFDDSIPF